MRHQFYPRILCVHCGASALSWVEVAGTGRVSSFTVVRRAVSAAYAPEVPYVVALIELDDNVVMMSNIRGCAPEDVEVGMRVSVRFEPWSEDISVPVFMPATGAGGAV